MLGALVSEQLSAVLAARLAVDSVEHRVARLDARSELSVSSERSPSVRVRTPCIAAHSSLQTPSTWRWLCPGSWVPEKIRTQWHSVALRSLSWWFREGRAAYVQRDDVRVEAHISVDLDL